MTVLVASPTAAAYQAWDPTARQVVEPDTTFLLDPDAEELRTLLSQDRMMAAREPIGSAEDMPPWLGGTKVAIVDGRFPGQRGFKCLSDTNYGFVAMPSSGLFAPGQGTIEMQVESDVAWSALSAQMPFRLWNDHRQYIQLVLSAANVRADFRHEQDPGGPISLSPQVGGQTFDADEHVSLAVTFLEATMRVYVEGDLVITQAGCIPPRFWGDNLSPGAGLAVSVGSTHLAVSGLRISRLARVPGETPAP